MEIFDVIKLRRSVRSYDPKPVSKETLTRILEAARLAPSAINRQPWHFIVVSDAKSRAILSRGRYAKFLRESPVVIVGCGDKAASPEWYVIDVSIALQQLVLAATAEGLGTCWVGSFDKREVGDLLSIPQNLEVIAMIAIGYPRERIDLKMMLLRSRNRKPLDEIVSYERYGGKG